MSALQPALARLEARLQTLVEGSLARLFPANELRQELARRLYEALRREARQAPDGTVLAPDQFILFLIPKTRRELVYTIGASWVPAIWRWYHYPRSISEVGFWSVVWFFLPMLAVVLLRKPDAPLNSGVSEQESAQSLKRVQGITQK